MTHLLFADDLLVFSGGNKESVEGVMSKLEQFFNWSGMEVNRTKSNFFTIGLSDPEVDYIRRLCNFNKGSLPIKYLGIPLSNKKLLASECSGLIKRITARVKAWNAKLLSRAGRVVLVRSVLQSMSLFWARIFLLPQKIIKAVNAICANFVWRGAGLRKGSHRVSWDSCCRPKEEGGLGLKNMRVFNKALALSHVKEVINREPNLWSRWLEEYWIKGRNFWDAAPGRDVSWIIKKLWSLKEAFLSCWNISQQQAVWCGVGSCFTVANAYNTLRIREPAVTWSGIVWNSFAVPSHAFSCWLAMRNKLLTKDNMESWNIGQGTGCSLCNAAAESRDHLFFRCANTGDIWAATSTLLNLRSVPSEWNDISSWILSMRASSLRRNIIAAGLTMAVHWAWRRRNLKIFEDVLLPIEEIRRAMLWNFKIKLYNLRTKTMSTRDRNWISSIVSR